MRYVHLTTVDDYHQAHILSAALEEAGILCIEANENTATILPHLRQGIDIRVKGSDYLKAKVICDRIEETRKLRCPECESTELKYMGQEARPLTFGERILKFLHVPVSGQMLIYGCTKCHATLKTR